MEPNGILLLDKPKNLNSFKLVSILRRLTGVEKIGHAGTLDPFASGVMVMLIGRAYTRLSDQFLNQDKEYRATLHLGMETDSYDCEGKILKESSLIPTREEIEKAVSQFQGTFLQTPPMFSAKKVKGKKLYELARKGITIERQPVSVTAYISILSYHYPFLEINVSCSKGTYVRSLAHDIGAVLGTGAHLKDLVRLRSGPYTLAKCIPLETVQSKDFNLNFALLTF